jgi:hypothetical protein
MTSFFSREKQILFIYIHREDESGKKGMMVTMIKPMRGKK